MGFASRQVHVRVKGQLAACSGGHALYHQFELSMDEDTDFCRFSYSPLSTPHILTVAPPTATHGDTITITGTGFGTNSSLILVLFGDVPCVVTSASGEEVTCDLGEGVAGYKQVFLQVRANIHVVLQYGDSGNVMISHGSHMCYHLLLGCRWQQWWSCSCRQYSEPIGIHCCHNNSVARGRKPGRWDGDNNHWNGVCSSKV